MLSSEEVSELGLPDANEATRIAKAELRRRLVEERDKTTEEQKHIQAIMKSGLRTILKEIAQELKKGDTVHNGRYHIKLKYECCHLPTEIYEEMEEELPNLVLNDLAIPDVVLAESLVKILRRQGYEVLVRVYGQEDELVLSGVREEAMALWRRSADLSKDDFYVEICIELYPNEYEASLKAELLRETATVESVETKATEEKPRRKHLKRKH